ncbi:MAG: hypothetical protein QM635_03895 [Microbacteriaceae bacterium]
MLPVTDSGGDEAASISTRFGVLWFGTGALAQLVALALVVRIKLRARRAAGARSSDVLLPVEA